MHSCSASKIELRATLQRTGISLVTSRDCNRLNLGISFSVLQKLAKLKIVLFRVLNDRNENFSHLVNEIFFER